MVTWCFVVYFCFAKQTRVHHKVPIEVKVSRQNPKHLLQLCVCGGDPSHLLSNNPHWPAEAACAACACRVRGRWFVCGSPCLPPLLTLSTLSHFTPLILLLLLHQILPLPISTPPRPKPLQTLTQAPKQRQNKHTPWGKGVTHRPHSYLTQIKSILIRSAPFPPLGSSELLGCGANSDPRGLLQHRTAVGKRRVPQAKHHCGKCSFKGLTCHQ